MTPSQRAARLQEELKGLAELCESTARTQRLAMGTGIGEAQVGVGPAVIEVTAKRIRHLLADLGPPATVKYDRHGDTRCPECGELVRL